tara:strand:+ start:63 stop:674 length:612 start_codon:yes stop_codon:yes gene_type:complete
MAYKMKGFPMMTGTALHQEAYKETRRVKRRRNKNRIAQNELSRLENSLEKLTERYGENPNDAQKDKLADLRFRIQKAREVADKRQAKYDKLTGRTTKKSDPSESEVDPTEPNKTENEELVQNLEEEEYDTAPENKIEELPDVSAEKEETEEERKNRLLKEAKEMIERQEKINTKTKDGGKTTASTTRYIKHKGHDTTPSYNLA